MTPAEVRTYLFRTKFHEGLRTALASYKETPPPWERATADLNDLVKAVDAATLEISGGRFGVALLPFKNQPGADTGCRAYVLGIVATSIPDNPLSSASPARTRKFNGTALAYLAAHVEGKYPIWLINDKSEITSGLGDRAQLEAFLLPMAALPLSPLVALLAKKEEP